MNLYEQVAAAAEEADRRARETAIELMVDYAMSLRARFVRDIGEAPEIWIDPDTGHLLVGRIVWFQCWTWTDMSHGRPPCEKGVLTRLVPADCPQDQLSDLSTRWEWTGLTHDRSPIAYKLAVTMHGWVGFGWSEAQIEPPLDLVSLDAFLDGDYGPAPLEEAADD